MVYFHSCFFLKKPASLKGGSQNLTITNSITANPSNFANCSVIINGPVNLLNFRGIAEFGNFFFTSLIINSKASINKQIHCVYERLQCKCS